MTEVEIFWPSILSTDAVLAAETPLREAGVETSIRLQPTRRGAELSVLVLLTTSVLKPLLTVLFEQFGESAADALRKFVNRLLKADSPVVAAPRSVVFKSSATGAKFVFTSGLPEEAFRKALTQPSGHEPGQWVWDNGSRQWLSVQDRRTSQKKEKS